MHRVGYSLEDPGLKSRLRQQNLLFSETSRPAVGPVLGTPGSFPGVKRPGREVDHSSLSSAKDKNEWSHTSTPVYTLMSWREIDLHDVRGSVHHSTIHTEKSNKMQQFIKIYYSMFS